MLNDLYKPSLTLLTDLYQLTMAYGYWKTGKSEQEAVFHLFYRKAPFGGSYALACGLDYVVDLINDFKFSEDDLDYLQTLTGNNGEPLFEADYLEYLHGIKFSCDIDAAPEGSVVFPHEPLLRIRGPILQCQLLETPLLNIINFQTLLATKAARICQAAKGEPVLEFGLRRAQGIDGALTASRAAYVGGCASTSNVLAGKLFDIPVKGTHAHSWIMSFDSEPEAFEQYAATMPNNCVFLVDTYDTIEGVKNAIIAGRKLAKTGHRMVGIRLDSGDLAQLSIQARKLLDSAGFVDAAIVASNDLDEFAITELKENGSKINIWGVGTKLVTAYDQPALGGVFKLGAIRNSNNEWDYKIKLSDDLIKVSNPGIQQVRRLSKDGKFVADVLYNTEYGDPTTQELFPLATPGKSIELPQGTESAELLEPLFRTGELVAKRPTLTEVRARAQVQLTALSTEISRLKEPESYMVGLDPKLQDLKNELIHKNGGQLS